MTQQIIYWSVLIAGLGLTILLGWTLFKNSKFKSTILSVFIGVFASITISGIFAFNAIAPEGNILPTVTLGSVSNYSISTPLNFSGVVDIDWEGSGVQYVWQRTASIFDASIQPLVTTAEWASKVELQDIVNVITLRFETVEAEVSTNSTDIETLQTEKTVLEFSILSLESELATSTTEADIITINGQIATLQTELAAATTEADITAINSEIATLQTAKTNLEADIILINAELDSLQANLLTVNDDLEIQITTLLENYTALNTELTNIEADILALQEATSSEEIDLGILTYSTCSIGSGGTVNIILNNTGTFDEFLTSLNGSLAVLRQTINSLDWRLDNLGA
jgi:hypothetical protein